MWRRHGPDGPWASGSVHWENYGQFLGMESLVTERDDWQKCVQVFFSNLTTLNLPQNFKLLLESSCLELSSPETTVPLACMVDIEGLFSRCPEETLKLLDFLFVCFSHCCFI